MHKQIAIILFSLLLVSTAFAIPDPGHSASEISGGTFDDDGANDFTFPRNVLVDTRIGIANPNPAHPLDITGSARATDIIATNRYYQGANPGMASVTCAANQYLGRINVRGGIVTSGACTDDLGGAGTSLWDGTEGTHIMPKTPATTHVSIGNTDNRAMLYVTGDNEDLGLRVRQTSIQQYATAANNYLYGHIGFNVRYRGGGNWEQMGDGANNGAGLIGSNVGLGNLRFFTFPRTGSGDNAFADASLNTYQRMELTETGDLGIGTTTPADHVHVYGPGNQGIRIQSQTRPNSILRLLGVSSNGIDEAQVHFNNKLRFAAPVSGANILLELNQNGNLGIGTGAITPANRLEIKSATAGTSGLRLTELTNAVAPIANPDAEKGVLSVDSNGDVILVIDQSGSGSGVNPGTAQRLTKYDASGTNIEDSVIREVQGRNIAIGSDTADFNDWWGAPHRIVSIDSNANGAGSALQLGARNIPNDGEIGGIEFFNHDGTTYRQSAAIYAYRNSSTISGAGRLDFNTAYNNIGGAIPRMTILTNGNVGIGTTSPHKKLHVAGNIQADQPYMAGGDIGISQNCGPGEVLLESTITGGIVTAGTCGSGGTGGIAGSGTINKIPKFTAATTVGDSSISETIAGFIGINGNSDPDARLRIHTGVAGAMMVDQGATFIVKTSGGSNDGFLWPRWTDNIMYLDYGSAGFNIRNSQSQHTMFMTTDHKVGIGTTTPSAPLDIRGPAGTVLRLEDTANGGTIQLQSDGIDQTHIIMGPSGSIDGASSALQINTNQPNGIRLRTNGNDRIIIEDTGEVGIAGNPALGRELDVNGEIYGDNIYGETQVYSGGTADPNKVCTKDGANCPNYDPSDQVFTIDIEYKTGTSGTTSTATCDPPKKVIGGGCDAVTGPLIDSYPSDSTAHDKWTCRVQAGTVQAYAICARVE